MDTICRAAIFMAESRKQQKRRPIVGASGAGRARETESQETQKPLGLLNHVKPVRSSKSKEPAGTP